ncbi:MAG: hypothetical protein NZM43_10020 [Saprospiraceae bacterium]|nr:hypothetical protein [Saprospiraceae bacterium]MDW8484650.1 hypothetical protein [Saprospiraceae bacterium]
MRDVVFRITALWAFSECALGGLMHAIKTPFTGIVVGGFAVLCVGLLAHASHRNPSVILRATMLVILVKAIVSPHSPPQAYIAVAFQGVLGALMLGFLRPYFAAAFLYGLLALAESALQKLLMLYIFFGKPLFEAADLFVADVLKKFGLEAEVSWAAVAAGVYVGIYALWGAVLGYWIPRLPNLLESRAHQYVDTEASSAEIDSVGRRKPFWKKMVLLLGVLLFIATTFLLTSSAEGGGSRKALYAVVRTLAVFAAWLFIVRPLVQMLIQRWAKRKSAEEQGVLQQLLVAMPDLRSRASSLLAAVNQRYSGWRRWPELALALLALALYEHPQAVDTESVSQGKAP